MAEFEFKMLGLAYYLNKGHYLETADKINVLYNNMKDRKNLVMIPEFADKQEEFNFYLNLQNPITGAFMDDSYPYCSYEGPTGNVLLHLESLSEELEVPLKLKYPLSFLDEINTPDKLKEYLDDVSYIGWIAAKLPESTFHVARDMIRYTSEDAVIRKHNLYTFSSEWNYAMLEWFYDNQDSETGFWGPRSNRTGKLLKVDLHNTASIIKSFVDEGGNNKYPEFPLRYKKELFENTIKVMSSTSPSYNNLAEWHGYRLRNFKGMMLITRYLWKDASEDEKEAAKSLFISVVKAFFKEYFVQTDNAFSYYPDSEHATIDGTGDAVSHFAVLGMLSSEKQKSLWGHFSGTCMDLGESNTQTINDTHLAEILKQQK